MHCGAYRPAHSSDSKNRVGIEQKNVHRSKRQAADIFERRLIAAQKERIHIFYRSALPLSSRPRFAAFTALADKYEYIAFALGGGKRAYNAFVSLFALAVGRAEVCKKHESGIVVPVRGTDTFNIFKRRPRFGLARQNRGHNG